MSLIKGDSYLEVIMREALETNNLQFKEQYMLYNSPKDLMPKYTLDFLVYDDNCKIDVECDGFKYHSGKDKRASDILRDSWVLQHGINQVLRFSYDDITHNIKGCVNEIKKILKIYTKKDYTIGNESVKHEESRKPAGKLPYIINVVNADKLHKVDMCVAACAMSYEIKHNGGIAFQLFDCTRNVRSEIFSIAYSNIDKKQGQSLALLAALNKMKNSAFLTIYSDSNWIVREGNRTGFTPDRVKYFDNDTAIWEQISLELKKHNYKFIYVDKNNPKKNVFHNSVLSKAKQKAYRANDDERITL